MGTYLKGSPMKTVIVIFAFGMVISSINAYAKPGVKGERKPPQKAVDGCVDISEGEQVTFVIPR